ncbi:MAG: zinc ribbon domain-containing protein [Clostridia bacterium]|nr:zinc ribbon domain-containing protein [Clostridia bacterium]
MFCPYCGNNVPDGAAFCSSCGNNLSANQAPAQTVVNDYQYQQQQMQQQYMMQQQMQMQQFQMQKNAVRQSEISALDQALRYFSQKRDVFEEYDNVCNLVNHYARGAKSALIVWGAIITSFGFLASLSAIENGFSTFVVFLLLMIVPGLAMITGGILMKINNRKKFNYYQDRYAVLSQELYNFYMSYPECPVGPEYANPDILALIMETLQSGRADTIKEAINLLIQDANDAEYVEYLNAIQENTAAINSQTRVAAIFAAASFFR